MTGSSGEKHPWAQIIPQTLEYKQYIKFTLIQNKEKQWKLKIEKLEPSSLFDKQLNKSLVAFWLICLFQWTK